MVRMNGQQAQHKSTSSSTNITRNSRTDIQRLNTESLTSILQYSQQRRPLLVSSLDPITNSNGEQRNGGNGAGARFPADLPLDGPTRRSMMLLERTNMNEITATATAAVAAVTGSFPIAGNCDRQSSSDSAQRQRICSILQAAINVIDDDEDDDDDDDNPAVLALGQQRHYRNNNSNKESTSSSTTRPINMTSNPPYPKRQKKNKHDRGDDELSDQ